MKKRIIPILLCLLLLAGCERYPEPKGDRAEFDAFVAEVDAARAANTTWTQEEKDRFTAYTPDISDQANALTQEELEGLFTPKEVERVSREEVLEDIDLFFRLLKSAYGGYDVQGGDETFFAAREEVLSHFTKDKDYTVATLKKYLENALSLFVRDGHVLLDNEKVWKETQYMYYVPNLYFNDTTGLDMDYVKPTIGPDGALTYCLAALSERSSGLPEQLGEMDNLEWVRAKCPDDIEAVAYRRTAKRGVTIMESRVLESSAQWEDQLYKMAEDGASYQKLPCFIIDIRSNMGGDDGFGYSWLRGYTGEEAEAKQAFGWKLSKTLETWLNSEAFKAISGEHFDRSRVPSGAGAWEVRLTDGTRLENDNLIFVLIDKNAGSSAESFLYGLRTTGKVITVGSNTDGCVNFGNALRPHLPNSGIRVQFGTSFSFFEGPENVEGIGILPDLWVNPADAQDAVLRLIDYYGLRE